MQPGQHCPQPWTILCTGADKRKETIFDSILIIRLRWIMNVQQRAAINSQVDICSGQFCLPSSIRSNMALLLSNVIGEIRDEFPQALHPS